MNIEHTNIDHIEKLYETIYLCIRRNTTESNNNVWHCKGFSSLLDAKSYYYASNQNTMDWSIFTVNRFCPPIFHRITLTRFIAHEFKTPHPFVNVHYNTDLPLDA